MERTDDEIPRAEVANFTSFFKRWHVRQAHAGAAGCAAPYNKKIQCERAPRADPQLVASEGGSGSGGAGGEQNGVHRQLPSCVCSQDMLHQLGNV